MTADVLDRGRPYRGQGPEASPALQPGTWVRIRTLPEILSTLDADQSLDALPFMPEMVEFTGRAFRVALRAQRTCVHPPEFPFRQLRDAVTLAGVRCDGSRHGGCQLGCMLFWKADWLTTDEGDDVAPPADEAMAAPALRATRGTDRDVFMCQGTELRRATLPGPPLWSPAQYLGFLEAGTFAASELAAMFARPAARRAARLLRPPRRRVSPALRSPEHSLGLEPGEWVAVRSRDEILATLDAHRTHKGLAFGGDMADQCGRRFRVLRRVEHLIAEDTGRLRSVRDTVILDGSICDRYFGCARGMPFLWREAWLRRVPAPDGADVHAAGPSSNGAAGSADADRRAPRRSALALAAKRGIDVVGAGAGLLLLGPVLAWTALAVAATQGFPILFRHERPGHHGKPFTMYKFRTMRPPQPGEVWYLTDADRTTPLGRFLRSTSLDELPELWNVLRGDMSLVGPRPLLTEYLDRYTPEQRRRHDMPPGITGWAAVHGRHASTFEDRLKLDVWYVDNWSLWLDMRILATTVGQVLRRSDVSAVQDLEAVGFPLPGVGTRPNSSNDAS